MNPGDTSQRTPDQQALYDLVDEQNKLGGHDSTDQKTVRDWADEYGVDYDDLGVKPKETRYGDSSGKADAYSDLPWYENAVDSSKKASRGKNKIHPNSNATGDHVVYKVDPKTGEVTNYKVYKENTQNPSGFDEIIGYDGIGAPHTNPVTLEDLLPHVHDDTVPGKIRSPYDNEIPK